MRPRPSGGTAPRRLLSRLVETDFTSSVLAWLVRSRPLPRMASSAHAGSRSRPHEAILQRRTSPRMRWPRRPRHLPRRWSLLQTGSSRRQNVGRPCHRHQTEPSPVAPSEFEDRTMRPSKARCQGGAPSPTCTECGTPKGHSVAWVQGELPASNTGVSCGTAGAVGRFQRSVSPPRGGSRFDALPLDRSVHRGAADPEQLGDLGGAVLAAVHQRDRGALLPPVELRLLAAQPSLGSRDDLHALAGTKPDQLGLELGQLAKAHCGAAGRPRRWGHRPTRRDSG